MKIKSMKDKHLVTTCYQFLHFFSYYSPQLKFNNILAKISPVNIIRVTFCTQLRPFNNIFMSFINYPLVKQTGYIYTVY